MLRKIEARRNEDLEPLENPGNVTGFQSPADDYTSDRLHIIQQLVNDPVNTYYMLAENDDMELFSIRKGSLLVVDRSIIPTGGDIVVLAHDGKLKARQLIARLKKTYFTTGQEDDQTIEVSDDTGVFIWGVVTWCCCPLNQVHSYVRTR